MSAAVAPMPAVAADASAAVVSTWETSPAARALGEVDNIASIAERAPIEDHTDIITAHQEEAIETFLVMGIMGYTHAFLDNDPYVTRLFSLSPNKNVRMQVIPATVPLLARWIHLNDLVEYIDNMNESHEQEGEGSGDGGDRDDEYYEDDDAETEVVEVPGGGQGQGGQADQDQGEDDGWDDVIQQPEPQHVPQEWLNPALSHQAQAAQAATQAVDMYYEDAPGEEPVYVRRYFQRVTDDQGREVIEIVDGPEQ